MKASLPLTVLRNGRDGTGPVVDPQRCPMAGDVRLHSLTVQRFNRQNDYRGRDGAYVQGETHQWNLGTHRARPDDGQGWGSCI